MSPRHAIFTFCLPLLIACAGQRSDASDYPGLQTPSQADTEITRTLERALDSNRLAMLVLGSNWCHDSKDFASMIRQPPLSDWLEQHYEVSFFNVGYLDHIKMYVEPYAVPVIYGTPTVLVVDPVTGTLLNRSDHYYWRNASNLSDEDARRYFEAYLSEPAEPKALSPALAAALQNIDDFESTQAQRIYHAYALLGPMLEKLENGEKVPGFNQDWKNLAGMRSAITGDLKRLRESAIAQDMAGVSDIQLEFPNYELFSDAAVKPAL
jgi:hypothetical protein